MASSVSLISATEKKSMNPSKQQQLQPFGMAKSKHTDSEPATVENISQEDTSDG